MHHVGRAGVHPARRPVQTRHPHRIQPALRTRHDPAWHVCWPHASSREQHAAWCMTCMGLAWRVMGTRDRTRSRRHERMPLRPHAACRPAADAAMFAWPVASRRQLQHDHATMLRMPSVMACGERSAFGHDMLGRGRPHMRAYGIADMPCAWPHASSRDDSAHMCTPYRLRPRPVLPASAENLTVLKSDYPA